METSHLDSTRQRVLQCIVDLHNARRPVSRNLVAQHLNERLSVVDDAVKRLKEDGLVRTVVPGIVEPVEQFPPDRPISKTVLPNGWTKLEFGDECHQFTPHESAVIGSLFHGDYRMVATWHEERRAGAEIVQLQATVRALQKELREIRRHAIHRQQTRGQNDLFTEIVTTPSSRRRVTS